MTIGKEGLFGVILLALVPISITILFYAGLIPNLLSFLEGIFVWVFGTMIVGGAGLIYKGWKPTQAPTERTRLATRPRRFALDTENVRAFFWLMSAMLELGAITLIRGAAYNLRNPVLPWTSYDLAVWWGVIAVGATGFSFILWNQVNDLWRFGLHRRPSSRVETMEIPERITPSSEGFITPEQAEEVQKAVQASSEREVQNWLADSEEKFSRLLHVDWDKNPETTRKYLEKFRETLQRLPPPHLPYPPWTEDVERAIEKMLNFIEKRFDTRYTEELLDCLYLIVLPDDPHTCRTIGEKFVDKLWLLHESESFRWNGNLLFLLQRLEKYSYECVKKLADEMVHKMTPQDWQKTYRCLDFHAMKNRNPDGFLRIKQYFQGEMEETEGVDKTAYDRAKTLLDETDKYNL